MPRISHTHSLNVQYVKDLRNRLGWTQDELALASDLSLRLIAKAEGGEEVSVKSVRAITAAFRSAGFAIDESEIAINPEVLARRLLQSYATNHAEFVEQCLDFLSPDIVTFVDGDPSTNPIAGTYRGLDEFRSLWRKYFSIFVRDGGSLGECPEIRVIGSEVFAWGHECIRVPEVPPGPPGFVSLRMRFKKGLLTYFEDRYEQFGMMYRLKAWAEEFPEADWLQYLNLEALSSGETFNATPPPLPPS